ncbi:hypothetical protein, partial [Thiolapillus sp.]
KMGYLHVFGDALGTRQARQLKKDGLWELKVEVESLVPPELEDQVPSLHAWLLKYDINKYLHVVLLHDRLDCLEEQGLSGFMEYPDALRAGLEAYLSKVTDHCRALPDFAEGMTLLVMGGLGRGFALSFKVPRRFKWNSSKNLCQYSAKYWHEEKTWTATRYCYWDWG